MNSRNKITFFSSVFSELFVPLCAILLIISIFIFLSCSSQNLITQEISIERDGQVIAVVKAEIARTHDERQQGLMFRQNLPDGEGMLFIFESDQILSFWMKNTYIPLSIAYISSAGRIIDIKDMFPHDESSVTSSRSVRYALEVPQGWFDKNGVKEGDIINIDVLIDN